MFNSLMLTSYKTASKERKNWLFWGSPKSILVLQDFHFTSVTPSKLPIFVYAQPVTAKLPNLRWTLTAKMTKSTVHDTTLHSITKCNASLQTD